MKPQRTIYFHEGSPTDPGDVEARLCLILNSDEAEAIAIRLLRKARAARRANGAKPSHEREASAVFTMSIYGAGVSYRRKGAGRVA